VVNLWALPKDVVIGIPLFAKLRKDIDWVGALAVSTSLGLISYILA
jgi:hypothetical protein